MTTVLSSVPTDRARSLMDRLLRPRSVAVIGASADPDQLGGRPLGLLAGYGFPGRVYVVNPRHDFVQGWRAYRSIADVPEPVDVAMIIVRADLVPGVLHECARAGVRIAMVLSSGFGEGTGAGAELSDRIAELIGGPMRIVGPNCEGVVSLPGAAPLSFSPILDATKVGVALRTGPVAVVSQSGGLGFAVAHRGSQAGIGFNYVISTGNEIDVHALEFIDELVDDPGTDVIVAVIEEFRDPEHLIDVARRCAETGTRLVVAKMGRSAPGIRGARAHTGHEAGDAAVYRELFLQNGILPADDEEEVVDILLALTRCRPMAGRRIGIVTTSGGAGIWLADACVDAGLTVPVLSDRLQSELASHMPKFGSPTNPVDVTAQFVTNGNFAPTVETLLRSGEIDGLILAMSLAAPGRMDRDRAALAELVCRYPQPIAVYSYTTPAHSCAAALDELGLPCYTGPRRIARGLAALAPPRH